MTETKFPPLPEPAMEGVDYELWGQNMTHDALFTADQMRAYAEKYHREACAKAQPIEFKREDRYIVIKRTDLDKYVPSYSIESLESILQTVLEGRKADGKPLLECVVVESDWPEYETTWAAIEARVTGKPSKERK